MLEKTFGERDFLLGDGICTIKITYVLIDIDYF